MSCSRTLRHADSFRKLGIKEIEPPTLRLADDPLCPPALPTELLPQFVILARVYNEENLEVATKFLDLPTCNVGNAENLFNKLDITLRSVSLSLSQSYAHTHTLSLSTSISLSHTHCLSLTHTHTVFHTHAHTVFLSHTLSLSL